ncbi:MAG: hypothetical protein N2438_07995 [Limisphaera sp.]|nr:hypothetical protein [Limisphaera sp.]
MNLDNRTTEGKKHQACQILGKNYPSLDLGCPSLDPSKTYKDFRTQTPAASAGQHFHPLSESVKPSDEIAALPSQPGAIRDGSV